MTKDPPVEKTIEAKVNPFAKPKEKPPSPSSVRKSMARAELEKNWRVYGADSRWSRRDGTIAYAGPAYGKPNVTVAFREEMKQEGDFLDEVKRERGIGS